MTQTTSTADRKTAGANETRRTVSGEIAQILSDAVTRIDRIDDDPLMREALARVTVRRFAAALSARFPGASDQIAGELAGEAEALAGGSVAQDHATARAGTPAAAMTENEGAAPPATTETGETADARDPQSSRHPRGGEQADPQGRGPERARGKGARHHGAQRVGEVDTFLRVGGA
jgi:hypothetical protein